MSARILRNLIFLPLLATASCELVGDVLQFGFWAGIIVFVLFLALIWFIVRALF